MREKGARNQGTLKRFEKAFANQRNETGGLRVIEFIQKKMNRNNSFSDHPSFEGKLMSFCREMEIKSLRKWAEKFGYIPIEGKGYSTSMPKDIVQVFSFLAQSDLKGMVEPAHSLDILTPTFACPHCGFMYFTKPVKCSKCKNKIDESPVTKEVESSASEKDNSTIIKRRGRPPKNNQVTSPKTDIEESGDVPKKRGRKSKNICACEESSVQQTNITVDPEGVKSLFALLEKFDVRLTKAEARISDVEGSQSRMLKTISKKAIEDCKNTVTAPKEPEPEEPAKNEEETYLEYIMSKYDLRTAFGENGEEEARDFVDQLQEVEEKAELITLFATAFGYAPPDIEDDFANLNTEQVKKVVLGI